MQSLEPESPNQRLTLHSLDHARHRPSECAAGRAETFMYLAKFFHRPPGDDDRELLLIPGDDPMIIGFRMRGSVEIQTEDFLRERFSEIGNAVAAYRRHAAELVAAGYMETTHTRYTRRDLRCPEAKLEWQKGLDDLMLAALSASLEDQARHLAALQDTPAAHEPLYLWLAAHRGFVAADSNEQTIRLAEAARDTLASRGLTRRLITHGRLPKTTWKP